MVNEFRWLTITTLGETRWSVLVWLVTDGVRHALTTIGSSFNFYDYAMKETQSDKLTNHNQNDSAIFCVISFLYRYTVLSFPASNLC